MLFDLLFVSRTTGWEGAFLAPVPSVPLSPPPAFFMVAALGSLADRRVAGTGKALPKPPVGLGNADLGTEGGGWVTAG